MMLSSMIKFPLLFISGIFTPIDKMGSWKFVSYISPLTYYTDLARYSVGGTNSFSPVTNLLALLGFSILFFIIAIRWHKKSLTKRF
jgi:ABC-2 type transport system permease protein